MRKCNYHELWILAPFIGNKLTQLSEVTDHRVSKYLLFGIAAFISSEEGVGVISVNWNPPWLTETCCQKTYICLEVVILRHNGCTFCPIHVCGWMQTPSPCYASVNWLSCLLDFSSPSLVSNILQVYLMFEKWTYSLQWQQAYWWYIIKKRLGCWRSVW